MKNYPSPMLFVLLALFLLFSIVSEAFPSGQNIINIFTASSTIGILAIGAAFVIGSGGIDLSTGSLMALSAALANSTRISTSGEKQERFPADKGRP